jgi:hypothetical protein
MGQWSILHAIPTSVRWKFIFIFYFLFFIFYFLWSSFDVDESVEFLSLLRMSDKQGMGSNTWFLRQHHFFIWLMLVETIFALEIWIPYYWIVLKKKEQPKHDKVQLKW